MTLKGCRPRTRLTACACGYRHSPGDRLPTTRSTAHNADSRSAINHSEMMLRQHHSRRWLAHEPGRRSRNWRFLVSRDSAGSRCQDLGDRYRTNTGKHSLRCQRTSRHRPAAGPRETSRSQHTGRLSLPDRLAIRRVSTVILGTRPSELTDKHTSKYSRPHATLTCPRVVGGGSLAWRICTKPQRLPPRILCAVPHDCPKAANHRVVLKFVSLKQSHSDTSPCQ